MKKLLFLLIFLPTLLFANHCYKNERLRVKINKCAIELLDCEHECKKTSENPYSCNKSCKEFHRGCIMKLYWKFEECRKGKVK
jgi:hypothetical protein